MTAILSFIRRLPLVPLFTGISLFIGLIVPSIYEFSQYPAARTRHSGLEQLAMAVLVATIVACSLAMWLRRKFGEQSPDIAAAPRKLQFKLRDVFVATTLAAILLATIPVIKPFQSSLLIVAAVGVIIGWTLKCERQIQARMMAILVSMFLPFAWVLAFNKPFGYLSGLIGVIPLGPGIVFAEILRSFMRLERDHSTQLAIVFVMAQLLIAVWLVRRGGKLPIVYGSLLLVTSAFSSLGLHAMVRM